MARTPLQHTEDDTRGPTGWLRRGSHLRGPETRGGVDPVQIVREAIPGFAQPHLGLDGAPGIGQLLRPQASRRRLRHLHP